MKTVNSFYPSIFPKPATLLNVTLLRGCFSRVLNCKSGTESRKISQIMKSLHLLSFLFWNVIVLLKRPAAYTNNTAGFHLSKPSVFLSNLCFLNIFRTNLKPVTSFAAQVQRSNFEEKQALFTVFNHFKFFKDVSTLLIFCLNLNRF